MYICMYVFLLLKLKQNKIMWNKKENSTYLRSDKKLLELHFFITLKNHDFQVEKIL